MNQCGNLVSAHGFPNLKFGTRNLILKLCNFQLVHVLPCRRAAFLVPAGVSMTTGSFSFLLIYSYPFAVKAAA